MSSRYADYARYASGVLRHICLQASAAASAMLCCACERVRRRVCRHRLLFFFFFFRLRDAVEAPPMFAAMRYAISFTFTLSYVIDICRCFDATVAMF